MGPVINSLDEQINSCLARLNAKEKAAVLNLVKAFVESRQEDETWTDGASVAEIDRRFREMESGKMKIYTLDEAEVRARRSYEGNILSVSKGRTIR
jgi:hypothetical protein